jgi:hypothetical protein
MSEHIAEIREIINQMERPFDTHAFIKKFARRFQVEYVELLSQYSQEPFEKIHNQIGKFLLEKNNLLEIEPKGKVLGYNIFGEKNDNEKWE